MRITSERTSKFRHTSLFYGKLPVIRIFRTTFPRHDVMIIHDDVIKWKHVPRNWPFVRGIHRSPGDSTHKDQWRRALIFSLICAWTNGWANNVNAGDSTCHRTHYNVTAMVKLYDALLRCDGASTASVCVVKNVIRWREIQNTGEM